MLGSNLGKVNTMAEAVVLFSLKICSMGVGASPSSHRHCAALRLDPHNANSSINAEAVLSIIRFIGTELINVLISDLFQNYFMRKPLAKGYYPILPYRIFHKILHYDVRKGEMQAGQGF